MKMFVCLKVVPDSETRPKPDGDGRQLDTGDVKWVVNPYDDYAIEQAVQLKEADGGELQLVVLADRDVTKAVHSALARGADSAHTLKVSGDQDSLSIAKALAAYLKTQEYDAVFFGKEAIDDQQGAVGPMVATLLDVPCVTAIDGFTKDGTTVTATRGIEGAVETVKVNLPAVFTTDKGLNEPRFANLKGIMKAKKMPQDTVDTSTDAASAVPSGFALPEARKEGRIVGEGADAVDDLLKALRDEAKVL